MATSSQMSFAGKARAMIVDLTRGFAAEAPRVMPLGDSNTVGYSNVLPDDQLESYRADLWSRVTRGGDWINYVGGHSNGPASLQDLNHQGVAGIRSTTVVGEAAGLGQAHNPDVVLIMLGTNDVMTEADAASTVPDEIFSIMQSIERNSPGTAFLVAQLPPVDPSDPVYRSYGLRGDGDAIRDAVNAQLPGMVAEARASGLDARFVPMPTLGTGDLYDGIHLTKAGHTKIAKAWYNAMDAGLDSGAYGGARTSTGGVHDITGSEKGDLLRGDSAANTISGRGGRDRIEGMGGADSLKGGPSTDVFVFSWPGHGRDTIRDFSAVDFIEIDASHFKGGLEVGESPILRSAADPRPQGSAGQFLYDRDDGRLSWDVDGSGKGKAVLLATLDGAPGIGPDDFLLV